MHYGNNKIDDINPKNEKILYRKINQVDDIDRYPLMDFII